MTIEEILRPPKNIAVIGLSPDPFRPSHGVAQYMQEQGFRIVPVNPAIELVLGERAYPDIESVPVPIDIVDIFRRSEHVPAIVDAAIRVGARCIWMQEGVAHAEAAARASEAGLLVVEDRCLLKVHRELRWRGQR